MVGLWFNYSSIMNDELSPYDSLYWNQSPPVHCDTARWIGIILCIAAVIGIGLNGALVYSFVRYKSLRSSCNIHIMFIAFMGLLGSCTILPLTGTSSVFCQWLYRRVGCQLSAAISFFYGCSSSYLLCVVSLNRCYMMMRPVAASKLTLQRSVVVSCTAMLFGFVWSILPILGWNEYVLEGIRTSCSINWYNRQMSYISFTFCLFIFVYLIPSIILIMANILTILSLKEMRRKLQCNVRMPFTARRIEMEQRITKCIIITALGFMITWTPYAMTLFVSAFRGKSYAVTPLLTFTCACFAKSSVIWIPCLYISTSTQFRIRFVNVNRVDYGQSFNQRYSRTVQTQMLLLTQKQAISSTKVND